MIYNPHEKRIHAYAEGLSGDVLLKHVFAEIQKTLAKAQINIEDFRDLYGADKIAEDLAYVDEKEAQFESEETRESKEAKRVALIFEGIFHKGAYEHGWLGNKDEVRVVKASAVDDIRHGVDSIIEFKKIGAAAQHLAIGVDVTYSNQLKEKFKKIKNDIANGTLGTVEYFLSENFKGKLKNIPRVVVGADQSHIVDLCKDMFVNPDSKRLARHPFQILQLKQMRLQLDAFAEYADSLGKKDIAALYRRDAEIVRLLLQGKSVEEGIRMGDWENDRVFEAIKKELENLK